MTAMLPPALTKPITLPQQRGFIGEGKNESTLSHVRTVRERSDLQEDWACDYGCNSGSPLGDAVGSYYK